MTISVSSLLWSYFRMFFSRYLLSMHVDPFLHFNGFVQVDGPVNDHHGEERDWEEVSGETVDSPHVASLLLSLAEESVRDCLLQFVVGGRTPSREVAVTRIHRTGFAPTGPWNTCPNPHCTPWRMMARVGQRKTGGVKFLKRLKIILRDCF